MGKGTKLTEADLLAGGCRLIRSFLLSAENDAAPNRDSAAPNDAAGEDSGAAETGPEEQNGAATDDGKPKTSGERTAKYRESLKGKQQQLNLMTTPDTEKRATLKALAKDVEIDGVHAVCAMAVRVKADGKALDAMRVAGDVPDIVELGVLASHDDVRPAVDAVIGSAEIRNLVAALLADAETCGRVAVIVRNPATLRVFAAVADNAELRACLRAMMADPGFLSLCSAISQDTQLRHAAQAAQANPKVALIAVELATSTPGALENLAAAIQRPEIFELGKRATVSSEIRRAVECAITRPRATDLGRQIISLKGMRGQMLRKLVALLLKPGSRAS
jgi:hypothetical protein